MTSALLALALLAALAGPIVLRLLRHPGFVTGRDGRLSTSITLALAWTVILLWLLLATLGYGLTAGGGVAWFQGPDGPLSSLTTVYLPLLGGPYAALIAAKAVVGMRVERGSMAKPAPKGTKRRPVHDLISNDGGRTDLVDLQYVALSAVTMLYVVAFFLTDVGGGLPKLPAEMWALTGAPAGAYLLNKVAVRGNPVITGVSVTDGLLTIAGGGFGDNPRVEVDGTPLPTTVVPDGTLTAPLPATAPPAFEVVVTTHGLRSDPAPYAPPTDPLRGAKSPL
ncbi:IPT/TIG domain-containing protein [Streptomyces sp. NPDC059957]|uniref:IPT/TIG domain-containing protein n=1 Tax=unclassified Streptomyces TaxID=2593676 RepID=UPI003664EEC0